MVDIPEQAVKAALEQFNTSDMTLYDSYTKGQEAMVRRMLAAAAPYMSGVKDEPGFEPYMRIVDFFDKDETAGSFLNDDGEGGFVGGIYRMAREIDRLREPSAAREQALEDSSDLCDRLEELAIHLDSSDHSKWCRLKDVPVRGYSMSARLIRKAIATILALSSEREHALEEAENQGNLKQWSIQDHLKTPGSIAEYLQATLDEGDSELLINAVSDAIRALKSQQNTETSAIEKKKFYHNEWPHDALMAARRDGFIDHNGGEAWRYQFTHKDEKGKYDLLYRDTSNSSIQAALPPVQTGGGE